MSAWWDQLRFATPWMAVVALVAPLVVLVIGWADERRRRALVGRLGEPELVRRMMASTSLVRVRVKRAVLALALALCALATARPQTPGTAVRRGHGLDLVVALDASSSMMVDDVGAPRLVRARALIEQLLAELDGDRVASVVFAGAAAHFPLTHDRAVALQVMKELGPVDLPGGSDLEGALRTATCLLRPEQADVWSGECTRVGGNGQGGDPLPGESDELAPRRRDERAVDERGKVIVLLTDGGRGLRNRDGRVERGPLEQVRRAVGLGVTVLVVGVGSEAGGVVPQLDADGAPIGDRIASDGRPAISKLDRDNLAVLAEAAGGAAHYFEVGAGPVEPGPLVTALARVKRGELEGREQRIMKEHYTGFLFAGFLLLVIEACIGTRRRVRHPEG